MPILAIYALLWYIYASYTTRRVKWAICHKSFAHLSIFSMIITMFRIWSCWSWKLQVFPRQGAFSWTAQRGAGRWSLNFFYDTTLRGWNRNEAKIPLNSSYRVVSPLGCVLPFSVLIRNSVVSPLGFMLPCSVLEGKEKNESELWLDENEWKMWKKHQAH